ncbi:hypothetical protein P7K49_026399 [Saguinus oedipus]|uniref:CYRIA/CYRIB Rac1 binding domain-containing protein n=1 Tax=Saguinus oedipus TaxID=9490 RepID=A0ABQ9UD27_SAGOE|nr:hypothetical protein P7K49_026399 [Saguinus oedipus]
MEQTYLASSKIFPKVGLCAYRFAGMGNLIKVLTRDIDHNAAHFFLDFENAQPTESEKEIYNQVNVVLKDAEGILEDLQSYRGAGHEIRECRGHQGHSLGHTFHIPLHFSSDIWGTSEGRIKCRHQKVMIRNM